MNYLIYSSFSSLLIHIVYGDCHFQEKEDLEAQSRDAIEKAERASSQVLTLQQELERTRQHANEALKAIDVERQQLRTANNKYDFLRTMN